ncbi:hypothetical protein [Succinispira mobilis]|uniref:hypothetical protein n=1 Tax=Succinispira mobilis TaxID=78120 RepID=UPI001B7FBBA8|nr:hypothetical protein [Succinispira mobilis]
MANSIINGVTEVVNKYGRIIVLEDDIVTSKWFLKYMNDALEVYKDEEKVMTIGGYLYPIDNKSLSTPFFLKKGNCWGWATWSRAWAYFERNPDKLVKNFDSVKIKKFNFDNEENIWGQVLDNIDGKIYTWAVFWSAIMFLKDGLILHPNESMTKNIGLDGSGVHCQADNKYLTTKLSDELKYLPLVIAESYEGYIIFKKFFHDNRLTLWKRIKNKLKKILVSL